LIKIAALPGDGIGKEVVPETLKVLRALDVDFQFIELDAGYDCWNRRGENLPAETVSAMRECKAALIGPFTTPVDEKDYKSTVMKIRKMFDLFANVRPAKSRPGISCIARNADLVIVRENTEGLYSGIEWRTRDSACALRVITVEGSERIAKVALELAGTRKKKLTIIHKANILKESDGLFRETCLRISRSYPDIKVEEKFVDAATMSIVASPESYDVLVTPNLYGDILSDLAAQVVGGIGLAPSASVGDEYAAFAPVHGSAPDIAGKRIANPIASILSGKMMLDYFGYGKEAVRLDEAVEGVLADTKVRTPDLGGTSKTSQVGDRIIEELSRND
jgi:isopropylmalate/isohomocitrate dehydrogenase-like protein